MRKFLLIMLVILAVPTFAQNGDVFRIASFMSDDAMEVWEYKYATPDGTEMTAVSEVSLLEEGWQTIDSIHYNELGQIVRLATHQLLDGSFRLVCYCDYTYNEMGLRATRENYNVFGGEPTLGGIYYYNYDENGNMTDRVLDFIIPNYEICEYTYYDNGLLQVEHFMVDNTFTGTGHENSSLIEYYYDANGNLTETHFSEWDLTSNAWVLQSMELNEYDELGNCVKREIAAPGGAVQDRCLYKYDTTISVEDIKLYANPEDDFPQLPAMNNMLTSYEHWTMDQNGGGLAYVCDYLLTYDCLQDTTTVNELSINSRVYPNPAQDYIIVESEDADYVQVLDICGREVYATEVNGLVQIDMKEYAAGVYFVRLRANGATSVQKIVKE